MSSTSVHPGDSGRGTSRHQLLGRATGAPTPGARPADPLPDPDAAVVLRLRADDLVHRLRVLRRGPLRGTRSTIDAIDAITEQLRDLQTTFSAVATRGLREDQRAELADARRSVTDALLLTLEMLQRLR